MFKQKIFLVNFDSLYEIFNEIKENLSFEIKNFKNETDLIKTINLEKSFFLILLKPDQNLLQSENVSNKNILYINNLPMNIDKIIETINIKWIKLKFNHQSKVNIKSYELNLNSKILSKKSIFLKLTEKEIEIILYLNSDSVKKNVLNLQKKIWGYSSNIETHTVETHIYRLRKKINEKFKDNEFILSDKNGYFIS
ncbi:helix-turn-helix domain-containing protein [Candidatus Pelagibacter sp.]|nr:helix-turn-helix domain-containing protein [Candidatus Pelagibacter sp.]